MGFLMMRGLALLTALLQVCSAAKDPYLEPHTSWQRSRGIPNVIGGREAIPGEFPFIVSLRVPEGFEGSGGHFCGGALIDHNVVLTAAHCLLAGVLVPVQPIVDVGRYARNGNEAGIRSFSTEKPIIHEEYRMQGGWYDNDIALLVLNGSANVEPARLPDSDCLDTGTCTTATAAGWGLTRPDDESSKSDVLMKVQLPLLNRRECMRVTKYDPDYLTTSMLCAGRLGKDTCKGDSGGPLFVDSMLLGVVSFGQTACGKNHMPGIYASVVAAKGWVQKQLQQIREGITPGVQPSTVSPPSHIGDEILISQFLPTHQSSTARIGFSSLAVDGDNRTDYRHSRTCTQTAKQYNPWWFVDLGTSRRISKVFITARSHRRTPILSNLEIQVGDTRPDGDGASNPACQSNVEVPGGETKGFECHGTGRFVTVRMEGLGVLALCEVAVFSPEEGHQKLRFEHTITFQARGLTGTERIGGLEMQTKEGIQEVLTVICLGTFSGWLKKSYQDCIAALPLTVNGTSVEKLTLLLANTFPRRGVVPTVEFRDGQVWFMGHNIWRSAWNEEGMTFPVDDISVLRQGKVTGSKSEMLVRSYEPQLWFEARGSTGLEKIKVTVVKSNGHKKHLKIECGRKSGQLTAEYQTCQSTEKAGTHEVDEIRLHSTGGSSVEIRSGRVFWSGTNVWYTAQFGDGDPMGSGGDELGDGYFQSNQTVVLKVDPKDYGYDWEGVGQADSSTPSIPIT